MIIIPTYNEDPTVLAETLRGWSRTQFPILVIDDGSAVPVPADFIREFQIRIITHPTNLGQGAALRTGFNLAVRENVPFVITVDADGQHPVGNLDLLLQSILKDEADVVFGSRFLRKEDELAIPWLRRIILRLAVKYNNYITGLDQSDVHNGLRVLSRTALDTISLREDRMEHATEIPLQVRKTKLRWVEVPVHIRYTTYAKKKGQPIWRAFGLAWRLWKLKQGR